MDAIYTVTVAYRTRLSEYNETATLECLAHSRCAAESRVARHYADNYPSLRVIAVTAEYTRS